MITNNFIKYLLFLLPWFISSILFKSSTIYYESLSLPFFAIPSYLFGIVWTILYILIAISIFMVYENSNKKYKKYLLINFISNQLFTFFFFTLRNNFLSLIDVIITLISAIYLYNETKIQNKKASYFLIPYIVFSIYALLLILSVNLLNWFKSI